MSYIIVLNQNLLVKVLSASARHFLIGNDLTLTKLLGQAQVQHVHLAPVANNMVMEGLAKKIRCLCVLIAGDLINGMNNFGAEFWSCTSKVLYSCVRFLRWTATCSRDELLSIVRQE